MIPPLAMTWDGEALRPRHPLRADKHLVVGQTYTLVEHQERSQASHNHEFAYLADAWRSLPETLADTIPTPEHLRKRALIETGYYDETMVDAGSQAAALRVAAMMRGIDDLAMVVTRGSLVVRRTAKSQSRRAMDKATFQRSKDDVLGWIAGVLGVDPGTLSRQQEAA
jgi:hypothetical protein